jgi:hypothetical protein
MRWHPSAIGKTITQTVVALCVFVVLLESFLGLAGVGQQEIIEPNTALGCWHIPNKLVTWRFEGYSHDRFSSIGLRDVEHAVAKPAGTVRIAVLGDSATEGLQVALNETFVRVLEKRLNERGERSFTRDDLNSSPIVDSSSTQAGDSNATTSHDSNSNSTNTRFEVMNFGCSSYSTGQQLVLYEKLVRNYKPDYVVVFYSKGDSLENSLESTKLSKKRKADPRPYFYLDGAGNLQTDSSVLALNAAKLHPSPLESFLRANSCIWGVFSQTNLQLLLHEKYYMRGKNIIANITAKIDQLTKGADSAAFQSNYAPQDKLKVTTAILERLGSEVVADGGKLVVMTFPDLVNDPEYACQRGQLKQLADRNQHGFLDLDTPVKEHPAPFSLFLAYHFSKQGHELIARELEKFLTNAR